MKILTRLGSSAVLAVSVASASMAEDINVAVVFTNGVENAWAKVWLDSFESVKAQAPHGVVLSLDYTENVSGDNLPVVLESYAETGKYDMIWTLLSSTDQAEELKDQFPEILFIPTGGGNRLVGDNVFYADILLHETSYLAGVYAGTDTKSNVLGVVGLFPSDNVNDQVNAYRAGALSVNPDVKVKVTFIESWYDPVKAAEAASAQIAAGADIIFQLGETFQVCEEQKIQCIGNYIDMSSQAPGHVPMSTLLMWDPQFNFFIDLVLDHRANGTAYAAPDHKIQYDMVAGGSDITELASYVSDEAKEAVAAARAAILSGELKVVNDGSLPTSD